MSISVEKAHKLNIHPDAIECIPIKHNREVIAVLSIDLWEPGDDWDGDWIGQLEGKIGSYLSLQIFQSKAC